MLALLAQAATQHALTQPAIDTVVQTKLPQQPPIPWMVWPVIGYLAGCISFAWIIGRAHGIDLMKEGSRNLGATNVGRVLGKKWGYLCFLLDALKGAIPVLAAGIVMGWFGDRDISNTQAWHWLYVGLACMIGHMFPFWLKFKGGKGVATGLGVLLAFWPLVTIPALAAFALWIVLVLITRYISVGSIAAAVFLPFFTAGYCIMNKVDLREAAPFLLTTVFMGALVVIRHRANIKRLRDGTETKIGAAKKP